MSEKPMENQARFYRELADAVEPGFAIRLWNGERIGAADGVALVINDPYVAGRLSRKPNFETLAGLWIDKRIDLEGGDLFDLVAARKPGLKARQALKKLPKRFFLKNLGTLFSKGGASGYQSLSGQEAFISGSSGADIRHHYDVSNAFYQLFLDQRMVYTCGYFRDWNNSLDQAQADKLDMICRKLRLKQGERLLDIGCGWGALLIHAVEHFGVTGTGVSLSEAQTELARERIRAKGLEDKITIHIKSYEALDDQFDKIASIGMFEAVGIANYDTYFSSINRLLKPGGLYLHHAITRRMKRDNKAFGRKSPEHKALVKYIFPGGELDHLAMSIGNLEAHGFEVHDVENWREHYGQTCRLWATSLWGRFDEAITEIGEARARLWYLYLAGCALAFERGAVQINQTLASKRHKGASPVPATREDLYR